MTAATEVRVCARLGCDNPLTKRVHEGVETFQQRKFCSRGCSTERLELGPRRCASPECGALLVRKTGENSADWRSRAFCSHSCYRWRTTPKTPEPRPKLPPRRWCGAPGCGLELKRKYGECGADFRKRRFCGRDCSNRAAGKPQTTALDLAPLLDTRTDWSQAACSREASDLAWWTDTGRDDAEVERLRELAVWYCAGCPLRAACAARGEAEKFGLHGGVLWRHVAGRRVPLDLLAPVESVRAS